ncbi:TniQ family protein [Peribacillus glennii]|uniref:TniQ domain-containing protein n=1 Tax=Peribacillus glennii TaxID=2303991 RepID=A0A372L7L0_9BACI|nr:TniQ family protein [Peribacillus glennii]RFU60743.1 hypothetical protein D0466_20535 [Peribacillus glennii]
MKSSDTMLQRLGIRPAPKLGESLSSFVFRLCTLNKINFKELIKFVYKEKYVNKDKFLIDVFPDEVINLHDLSILCGHDVETLKNHSFGVIFNKIYNQNDNRKRAFKLDMNGLLIKDKRRFCIKCLAESGNFKLLWQVKGVNCCEIHKLPLVDTCQDCGEIQPYLHEGLMEKHCFYCYSELPHQVISQVTMSKGNDESRIIDNWTFLLNPSLPFTKVSFPFNTEQSIALTLLYAQSVIFTKKILGRIKEDRLKSSIKNLNNSRSVLVSDVLYMSKEYKINAQDLLGLQIDDRFAKEFACLKDKQISPINCATPWCLHKGSNNKMQKVVSSYHRLKDKYLSMVVCTSCNIRYGVNITNNEWEDVENQITLISDVIKMLEKGESIRGITRIAKSKTYQILGYILFHELFSTTNLVKIKKENMPTDDVSYFYEIYEGSMAFPNLYKKAKRLFAWNMYELGYYLASPVVQNELNLTENIKRVRYFHSKTIVKGKVEKIVNAAVKSTENMSLLQIAGALEKTPSIFRHYSLNDDLKTDINNHNNKLRKTRFRHLYESVERFFTSDNNQCKFIVMKDVYSYLGINRSYVRRNNLTLDHYISEKINCHNEEYSKRKVNEMIMSAVKVIDEFMTLGERPTMKQISAGIGISVATLYEYQEVLQAISDYKRKGRL